MHTFGRDLKWNTHIHILVTEGAMGKFTNWKSFSHFPYDMLRKRFMTKLLFELSKSIKTQEFKKLKNSLYIEKGHGFYVHAPKKNNSNVSKAIVYTTRYTNRPAIAEARITNYDKVNNEVTFFYDDHYDNIRKTITLSVFEFIKLIIVHIPDEGFNMTRYYGIYAMKKSKTSHLKRIKEKLTKPLKWADKLFKYFKKCPLKCTCGNTLKFKFFVEKKSKPFFQLLYSNLS